MIRIPFDARWTIAAAATCLTFGWACAAQAEDDGWYIGATLPLMFIDDTDSTAAGSFAQTQLGPQGQPVQQTVGYSATVGTEHDTGYKLGGVLGRSFGSGLRIEGELFIANAEVSKLTHSSISVPALSFTLPGELPIPVSGTADQLGAMVNLWYDFDTGDVWTPYIGGGLGFIRVDQGDLRYDTGAVAKAVANALAQAQAAQQGIPPEMVPPVPVPEVPSLSASDTAFAYQIGAGVGYALSDSTTLQIGYRLQMVDGLSFSGENAVATVSSETNLRIHFLEIGIRYQF